MGYFVNKSLEEISKNYTISEIEKIINISFDITKTTSGRVFDKLIKENIGKNHRYNGFAFFSEKKENGKYEVKIVPLRKINFNLNNP